MAYGIAFEKKGDKTEVRFGGEWPERCEFDLNAAAVTKLGELICALAKKRKKSFELFMEESENGLYVYGKRNWYRGSTLIRFEFDCTHPHFRIPCHNRFNYDGFSSAELEEFGNALTEFEKSGVACIGEEDLSEFAQSFDESLLTTD